MIGDYAQVNREGICINKDTVVRIISIDCSRSNLKLKGCAYCVSVVNEDDNGGVWLKYLDPIPLTPKILEKNGFKVYGESWYLPTDNESETVMVSFHMYNTIIDVKKGDDNFFKTVPCKYRSCAENRHVFVHELQNALRLCNIDKQIIL